MPLSRRDLLRVAAVVAAPAVLPDALAASTPDAAWTARALARLDDRPRLLRADERATIAAIADAIIPRSETPGALEIGAPEFIELLLAEWLPAADVATFRAGVAALDERARTTHGAAWPALPAELAATEIAWAEANVPEPTDAQRALRRIKGWTIHAWITSETIQRQVIRTNITPGKYEGCVPRPAARGGR
jgi:hypothetical protein